MLQFLLDLKQVQPLQHPDHVVPATTTTTEEIITTSTTTMLTATQEIQTQGETIKQLKTTNHTEDLKTRLTHNVVQHGVTSHLIQIEAALRARQMRIMRKAPVVPIHEVQTRICDRKRKALTLPVDTQE